MELSYKPDTAMNIGIFGLVISVALKLSLGWSWTIFLLPLWAILCFHVILLPFSKVVICEDNKK